MVKGKIGKRAKRGRGEKEKRKERGKRDGKGKNGKEEKEGKRKTQVTFKYPRRSDIPQRFSAKLLRKLIKDTGYSFCVKNRG